MSLLVKVAIDEHADYKIAELDRNRPVFSGDNIIEQFTKAKSRNSNISGENQAPAAVKGVVTHH